jgi:alpha-amylase
MPLRPFLVIICLLLSINVNAQTTHVKKIVFQSFWWDYKNNNYPNGWANYLTDLAPRLKGMGVDAVWIPPTVKNQAYGEKGVGYAPYDHYDLGDKFQKGDATTRIGTKDDLLRMVAVLHANGIEVVQDIVPNHLIGAGSDTGGGGQDPAAPTVACTDKWKNFRYTCYKTPATDQSAADYFSREGRFPKNHQNFNPSPGGCTNLCDANADPICWQGFGPDIAYLDGAIGLSSNATTFNPDQTTYSPYNNGGIGVGNGYMRKHTREWLIWYKKQMGFDGIRIDAVKHFPNAACEDFLYNLQNSAGWANGGNNMFAVGEWVGGNTELNAWTAAMNNRSGTFDFSLRAFHASGGLRGMIYGNGAYDMGALPGAQQTTRFIDYGTNRVHRTVPFVNNHDTYRPQLNTSGDIIGWNTGDELSAHVDIREPRLAAAYAVMCAMDGNPQIFIEDVLNIANQGKRFSHLPTNTTDLPANQDIVNIMKAHGALNFKSGSYAVRSSEAYFWNMNLSNRVDDDYIIIERSAKAIIGATDNWTTDQDAWVDTDFPLGTVLQDYSGGITTTTTVQGPDAGGSTKNRVNIKTRAVGYPSFTYSTTYADHGANYHGYSIWAPVGQDLNAYSNAPIVTSQEWEMSDDLGDSHCSSLGQGGKTPDNSPNQRVVGKIFVATGSTVTYSVTLGSVGTDLTVDFYDLGGNLLHSNHGNTASIDGNFTNSTTRWITAKVRNTTSTTLGQKCWVKLTYSAPATVITSSYPAANTISIWTSNGGSSDWTDCRNWEEGLVPATCSTTILIPHAVKYMPLPPACFTGTWINNVGVSLRTKVFLQGAYNTTNGLMNDNLRVANLIPTEEPYNALNFGVIAGNGGENVVPLVFATTGNDAIVDWIFLELRSKTNSATKLYTRSALLQRDGDVVDLDGFSPVHFKTAVKDDYFVVVRHRNHLGVRTADPIVFGEAASMSDFTLSQASAYQNTLITSNSALTILTSNKFAIWSSNANVDFSIKYNGSSNDRVKILTKVGITSPNSIISGYFSEDVNMDGFVKYNGSSNDRVSVLLNLGIATPNNIILQHLE